MDYLALKEKRRAWGKAYRDRKKAGVKVAPRKRKSTSEEPMTMRLSPTSDAIVAELSARTPTFILYADGCRWDGMMSRRMDEALADHRQRHGRGTRKVAA